jgi:ABC-2 type transport system ATP-binding protein
MDTPGTQADGIPAGGAQGRQEPPALQLTGLLKRFGDKTAVDHIDLSVPRGSFFGLVGPNGAGKTTSLSMAVGLLQPDGGSAPVFGIDVWARPGRRQAAPRRPARRHGPAGTADRA